MSHIRRALLLAWAILTCIGTTTIAADKPNVIFLLTDDQRWDTLGCMGNDVIQTPNIDRLAADGVVFDNMFVTTSICYASRASILTGQYNRRHQINGFNTPFSPEALSKTYPLLMKQAGYRVGFIGKWGVGKPPKGAFDYDRTFPGQGHYEVNVDGAKRHLTSIMGDQALEFIQGAKPGEPFCLSISFKAAHVQDSYNLTDVPFRFDRKYAKLYRDVDVPLPATATCDSFEKQPLFMRDSECRMRWAVRFWGPAKYQDSVKGYYRLITGVDEQVGRIVQALKAAGQLDNTIIVFTGDNGFFLGEHGFAGKWMPHEESIRVPLVIYDPRLPKAQRGTRRAQMALNIDIAPTILDAAGVAAPSAMQGMNLVPILQDASTQGREAFFYEHLFKHPRIPMTEGVRTERFAYWRYVEKDPVVEELYDLSVDPHQTKNLAADSAHAETLQQMRQLWQQQRDQVR